MDRQSKLPALFANRTEDDLIELIEGEDFSLAKIAAAWGVTRLQVQRWIDLDDDRRARVEIARQNAADACDRKAEAVLLALRSGATAGDIARARELASHYRWQARVRNPQRYGDHRTLDVKVSTPAEQMTDAELYAIARKAGLTGQIINSFAELVNGPDHAQPDADGFAQTLPMQVMIERKC